MTKALCKFPKDERTTVAIRRYKSKSGGLGWLAAKDYLIKNNALPKEEERITVSEEEKVKTKKIKKKSPYTT